MTEHPFVARYDAARKLITNHERVLRDLCRADGPPTSQPELARLPGQEKEVNHFLYETARRLLGRRPGQRPGRPASTIEGAAWAGAAKYLAGRLQVSEEEVGHVPGHEGRKADMSPAAGAAMRAVLKEMGRVGDDAADAAAGHTLAARHAAANKLITNHERVLRDLCRTDGAPVSQPELVRLPGAEAEVNVFLREAARRLLGRQPGQRARMPTREEGAGWAGAAKYLAGRLQVSEEEVGHVPGHEGRKADMSPAAGAAVQSVLAEMAKEGGDAAAGLGGARAMNSSHIEYEHADCTEQLTLLTASWITQALFSIGALLMLTMHKVLTHVEPKLFVGSFIVCAVGSCTYLAKNSGMDEIEISGRKVPIA